MDKSLLAALLIAAAPSLALAQAATGGSQTQPIPNQANPQAQANENLQPPNAHRVEQGPGLGQADRMPTPELNQPMTKMADPPGVPHSKPTR